MSSRDHLRRLTDELAEVDKVFLLRWEESMSAASSSSPRVVIVSEARQYLATAEAFRSARVIIGKAKRMAEEALVLARDEADQRKGIRQAVFLVTCAGVLAIGTYLLLRL